MFNCLLAESPVRIHGAVDREALQNVSLHRVGIYQHFAGLSTQLSHDQTSRTSGIPQMTSTALEPTSSKPTTHISVIK